MDSWFNVSQLEGISASMATMTTSRRGKESDSDFQMDSESDGSDGDCSDDDEDSLKIGMTLITLAI